MASPHSPPKSPDRTLRPGRRVRLFGLETLGRGVETDYDDRETVNQSHAKYAAVAIPSKAKIQNTMTSA